MVRDYNRDQHIIHGSLECHLHMCLEQEVLTAPSPSQAQSCIQLWTRVLRGKKSLHPDLEHVEFLSPQVASRLKLADSLTTRFNFAHLVHALNETEFVHVSQLAEEQLKLVMCFLTTPRKAEREGNAVLKKIFLLWFSLLAALDSKDGKTINIEYLLDKLSRISSDPASPRLEGLLHQNERLIRKKARRIVEAGVPGEDDTVNEIRQLLVAAVICVCRDLPKPSDEVMLRLIYKERGISPVNWFNNMTFQDPSSIDWLLWEEERFESQERQDAASVASSPSIDRPRKEDLVAWTDHDRHDEEEQEKRITARDQERIASPSLAERNSLPAEDGSSNVFDSSHSSMPETSSKIQAAQARDRTAEEDDSVFEDDDEEINLGPLKKRTKKVQQKLPVVESVPRAEAGASSSKRRTKKRNKRNSSSSDDSDSGSDSDNSGRDTSRRRKKYSHWTEEEVQRLKDLVPKYRYEAGEKRGNRPMRVSWAALKRKDEASGNILKYRDPVQLKDKWRDLNKGKPY